MKLRRRTDLTPTLVTVKKLVNDLVLNFLVARAKRKTWWVTWPSCWLHNIKKNKGRWESRLFLFLTWELNFPSRSLTVTTAISVLNNTPLDLSCIVSQLKMKTYRSQNVSQWRSFYGKSERCSPGIFKKAHFGISRRATHILHKLYFLGRPFPR